MGFFKNLFSTHNSHTTASEEELFSWTDKEYLKASSNYFSGMEKIESSWSVIYNLKDYTGDRAEKFIQDCYKNIKDFYAWINAGKKYGETVPPSVPAFKRLSMIYEKQGNFQKAIDICAEAIEIGAINDGAKGQMRGRLARLIKKSEITPGEDILKLLE